MVLKVELVGVAARRTLLQHLDLSSIKKSEPYEKDAHAAVSALDTQRRHAA